MPKQRTAKSEKIDTTKLIASIKDQDCLPNDYLADGYHDKTVFGAGTLPTALTQ